MVSLFNLLFGGTCDCGDCVILEPKGEGKCMQCRKSYTQEQAEEHARALVSAEELTLASYFKEVEEALEVAFAYIDGLPTVSADWRDRVAALVVLRSVIGCKPR